MKSIRQHRVKGDPTNGDRSRKGRKPERGITREELLRDKVDDPQGAEEFVALLHELRRKRAAAALEQS